MADQDSVGRVTGIGGVFFLANGDHVSLAKWYEAHLGIPLQEWGGGVLEWKNDRAEDGGSTVWNVAAADSEWFSPSQARFMINYRVDDHGALIAKLISAGVTLLRVRLITRMACLHGSLIPRETRSSSGSRWSGMIRTSASSSLSKSDKWRR